MLRLEFPLSASFVWDFAAGLLREGFWVDLTVDFLEEAFVIFFFMEGWFGSGDSSPDSSLGFFSSSFFLF